MITNIFSNCIRNKPQLLLHLTFVTVFTVIDNRFCLFDLSMFRMSDYEDEKRSSSTTKSLKFRRASIEVDVTSLVKSGKISTKSVELTRMERHLADYNKELDSIDERSKNAESELEAYELLKSNMDSYFANELTIDMSNDDHRKLTAFLKDHVSTQNLLTDLFRPNFHLKSLIKNVLG